MASLVMSSEIGILVAISMSLLFISWNHAESTARSTSTSSSKNLRKFEYLKMLSACESKHTPDELQFLQITSLQTFPRAGCDWLDFHNSHPAHVKHILQFLIAKIEKHSQSLV
uniref:Uncharacterized protein n=1 Tax=Glossina pallidipes TaxID=7398 RepID=A0A1B0A0H0_GLOPL